jgi:hypothetical protein
MLFSSKLIDFLSPCKMGVFRFALTAIFCYLGYLLVKHVISYIKHPILFDYAIIGTWLFWIFSFLSSIWTIVFIILKFCFGFQVVQWFTKRKIFFIFLNENALRAVGNLLLFHISYDELLPHLWHFSVELAKHNPKIMWTHDVLWLFIIWIYSLLC